MVFLHLASADILEPIRSAIFLVQESFSISKSASLAATAFRRIGAIKVWDVLVSDVAEP